MFLEEKAPRVESSGGETSGGESSGYHSCTTHSDNFCFLFLQEMTNKLHLLANKKTHLVPGVRIFNQSLAVIRNLKSQFNNVKTYPKITGKPDKFKSQ